RSGARLVACCGGWCFLSFIVFSLFAFFFFFTDPAPAVIYSLSLHDALPICSVVGLALAFFCSSASSLAFSTRCLAIVRISLLVRSEEHTSELQSRFDLVCRLLLEKKNIADPDVIEARQHVVCLATIAEPCTI